MLLEPGQRLAHCRIERLIGEGGMRAVYLAQDTRLDPKIALKVLPPEPAGSPEGLERFQREANALAALETIPGSSPSIRSRRPTASTS